MRLVVEVIWPLFLFFILVLVRATNKPFYKGQCKYMPSLMLNSIIAYRTAAQVSITTQIILLTPDDYLCGQYHYNTGYCQIHDIPGHDLPRLTNTYFSDDIYATISET